MLALAGYHSPESKVTLFDPHILRFLTAGARYGGAWRYLGTGVPEAGLTLARHWTWSDGDW